VTATEARPELHQVNQLRDHAPAWAAFNRNAAGSGDIGIWHETYRVPADHIETRYGNLAPFGLGKALGVRGRFGAPRNSTHQKMNETDSDYMDLIGLVSTYF
jgi:hypothetical protein